MHLMHWVALWSTKMQPDAPIWLFFFCNIFWIAPSATKLIFNALLSSYWHHDAPRCTVMHRDAPWCTEMHRDAPSCTLMHPVGFVNFWIASNSTKLLFIAVYTLFCIIIHRDAPSTTELAVCILNAPSCTKLYFLSLFAPWCNQMHQDAPRCTVMHRVAPWCTEMAFLLLK